MNESSSPTLDPITPDDPEPEEGRPAFELIDMDNLRNFRPIPVSLN